MCYDHDDSNDIGIPEFVVASVAQTHGQLCSESTPDARLNNADGNVSHTTNIGNHNPKTPTPKHTQPRHLYDVGTK
jgi:hypothetical protein